MKRTSLIIFSILCTVLLFGQSKTDLERKRASIQNEIELIGKRLKQTKEDRKKALDNYLALQRKIQKRSQLIRTLEQEDDLIEERIARTNDGITSLEEDAKVLELEYGLLIRQALRQKLSDSYLSFIFSSKDFNEALKRWRYLNQYRAHRARQTQIIKDTQRSLIRKKETLSKLSLEKEKLLAQQRYQQKQLNLESERKNKLYKDLKKNERGLRAELKDQQEVAFQLKSAILNLIGDTAYPIPNTSSGDITLDFQRGKQNLRWPIKSGMVERFFGRQAHPTLSKIEIVNNGIDIRSDASTSVFASFSGEVAGKFTLPNGTQSVLIKHGEYYTVYSNMDHIYVDKGEPISTQQELGVLSDDDRILHFEIWRQKTRLNPLDWLAPK